MASTKKDKDASAPEAKECANCLARSGQNGAGLMTCTRCKITPYCGRACQSAHWKAGHKRFCVTPEERAPQPASAPLISSGAPSELEKPQPVECAICLDPLSSGAICTLPCTHAYHAKCIEGLRSFGIKQVCPMCRAELPPGPEQLFEEGVRRYLVVKRRVDRGGSWGPLTKAQQREMVDVVGMWQSAAEQGYANAQSNLGVVFDRGQGVKQDYGEAVRWYRQAAEQGYAKAQYNLGVKFHDGQDGNRDYGEAVRWWRMAAGQGVASAQFNLGVKYSEGQGVKQNSGEAIRWWRMAAEQGHANAQHNLGVMYANGQGVNQNFAEAVNWFRKAAEQGLAGAEENALCAEEDLRKQTRHSTPKSHASATTPFPSANKCANCGIEKTEDSVTLKPCSWCKVVVYCGKACQAQHWKGGGHREVCK